MGRNNQDFTRGKHGGGTSNPANWGNEDDHKPSKPQKITSDFEAPDYADHYEQKSI